ncbi:MAG: hypothetical protein MJ232_01170 [archaeon]|nr:hypothetical protein [archaeon]
MSSLNNTLVTILNTIWPLVLAAAIIVTFVAIITTGFEIIMNRKDDGKRKDALMSLLYVAIGTIFIVGSLFITNLIFGVADDIAGSLQEGTVNQTAELVENIVE